MFRQNVEIRHLRGDEDQGDLRPEQPMPSVKLLVASDQGINKNYIEQQKKEQTDIRYFFNNRSLEPIVYAVTQNP